MAKSPDKCSAVKGGREVSQAKNAAPRSHKLAISSLMLICLLSLGSLLVFSQDRSKPETIEATAAGTDTQLGKEFNITLTIDEYSLLEDKQILVDAFRNGKDKGLVNALSKMKAVGHIAVTGTLGCDVSYIELIPTPTGRKIRFVTNRLLRFGEVNRDARSTAYNLTAGEIDLNDANWSKGTGIFYPAAELVIDKQGELQMKLVGDPWKLVDLLDWKVTPGID
jgi:hypothetical protein